MEIELNPHINFSSCSSECTKEFPIVDSSMTYSEFFQNYLIKNQACLIKNVSCNWKSAEQWVQDGRPNFSYLKSKYGQTCVSVQDCSDMDYNSKKRDKWTFRDYLIYWEDFITSGYPEDRPLYYLKDWHLKNESPDDDFYEVPVHFSSDWLNEYLVGNCLDDYRFVYMGVEGTGSPFHVDVMTSYSWSTNICGQKRWVLFPPGEEHHLRDRLGNLPEDITHLKHDRTCFEVLQDAGDAIFVPSNWHHQVWNLKDTISINHNWINGCNLHSIWGSMAQNLSEVKHEIRDCKDMEDFFDHCQVMLRASFGLNFAGFYDLILYIARKRIELLENCEKYKIGLCKNRTLGKNHVLYDLSAIKHTLKLFTEHEDVGELICFKNAETPPRALFNHITTTLNDNKK